MQLGALMTRLEDSVDAAMALEAIGDLVLFAQVREAGSLHAETPGQYVANASRRFAATASSEDWLGLMSAMERSGEPAKAAVDRMVRWALAADAAEHAPGLKEGCSCGGNGGCDVPR